MPDVEISAGTRNPDLHRTHGHVPADHAGRAHQHLVGVEVEPIRGQLGHQQGVLETLRARAGVGVAGVDDQRLHAVVLQVEVVDDDGGGLDLVGGEDAARVARSLRLNHAQVALLAARDRAGARGEGLDAAGRRARPKSGKWWRRCWTGPPERLPTRGAGGGAAATDGVGCACGDSLTYPPAISAPTLLCGANVEDCRCGP